MNKIIWTPPAEIAYAAIFESVAERWSYAIVLRLERAVDELIENLQKYKHFCPAAPTLPNARRCVVTKQTSLIYTVEGDTIYIVSMYDNRSDITF